MSIPSAKTIIKAALLVGTLDILAACAQFYLKTGKEPFTKVLKFVASGLLGKTAYEHGDAMAFVGLLIHYCIATAFTILFFLIIAKTSFAKNQPLLTGILYGAFIWVVMNLLVLPMTKAPALPKTSESVATGMGILIICVGIPLAYISRRSRYKQTQSHNLSTSFTFSGSKQ